MNFRVKDRTGETYEFLKVLKFNGVQGSNKHALWLCKCICGKEISITGSNLARQKSCGCKRKASSYIKNTAVPKRLWSNIISSAKKREILFAVTPQEAEALFTGMCALSGIAISLSWEKQWESCSASLDRIDSTLGYIESNIQWVHKEINRMKGRLDEHYFFLLCEAVIETTGSQELACVSGQCDLI